MTDVEISVEQQMRTEANALVHHANAIRITNQKTYSEACAYLQNFILPFRKKWVEYWAPLKDSAWKTYRGIQDKFRQGDEYAAAAERAVKTEIRKWDEGQQKLEGERQRQAQMEAEKAAEEERLRAAIYAESGGASPAEIEAIAHAPMAVVAPRVEPSYQRTAGISTRANWKAQVKDLWQLVKAAAKDKGLLAYLLPNEAALNARARAEKSTLNIPGVVAYNDSVVSARGR
jgi:hypothetical protein